jgi:hypothetical protein
LILATLQQRTTENWLVNYHNHLFSSQVEEFSNQLQSSWQLATPPRILLGENDPHLFLALFLACVALDYPVFLANPSWGNWEWQQVNQLVQPNLIWHSAENKFTQLISTPDIAIDRLVRTEKLTPSPYHGEGWGGVNCPNSNGDCYI